MSLHNMMIILRLQAVSGFALVCNTCKYLVATARSAKIVAMTSQSLWSWRKNDASCIFGCGTMVSRAASECIAKQDPASRARDEVNFHIARKDSKSTWVLLLECLVLPCFGLVYNTCKYVFAIAMLVKNVRNMLQRRHNILNWRWHEAHCIFICRMVVRRVK